MRLLIPLLRSFAACMLPLAIATGAGAQTTLTLSPASPWTAPSYQRTGTPVAGYTTPLSLSFTVAGIGANTNWKTQWQLVALSINDPYTAWPGNYLVENQAGTDFTSFATNTWTDVETGRGPLTKTGTIAMQLLSSAEPAAGTYMLKFTVRLTSSNGSTIYDTESVTAYITVLPIGLTATLDPSGTLAYQIPYPGPGDFMLGYTDAGDAQSLIIDDPNNTGWTVNLTVSGAGTSATDSLMINTTGNNFTYLGNGTYNNWASGTGDTTLTMQFRKTLSWTNDLAGAVNQWDLDFEIVPNSGSPIQLNKSITTNIQGAVWIEGTATKNMGTSSSAATDSTILTSSVTVSTRSNTAFSFVVAHPYGLWVPDGPGETDVPGTILSIATSSSGPWSGLGLDGVEFASNVGPYGTPQNFTVYIRVAVPPGLTEDTYRLALWFGWFPQ